MIRNSHPATLAATAIVSLAIGFGFANLLPSRAAPVQPIIDANAWEEAAPAAPNTTAVSIANRPGSIGTCSAWEISDVAMEEVLDQMIRRGWRPPNQGDAIAAMDVAQTVGLSATDPSAPMPYRRSWISSDQPAEEDAAAAEEPSAEAFPADQSASPAEPSPPPA